MSRRITSEAEALREATRYGRNFAAKSGLDLSDCEQEARISAWRWCESAQDRCTLWDHVRLDLADFARRSGAQSRGAVTPTLSATISLRAAHTLGLSIQEEDE